MSTKDDQRRQPKSIPNELVFEILSRLPVRSLLRFTSVSKSWLNLISQPDFVKRHLQLSSSNPDYARHMLLFMSECRDTLDICPLSDVFDFESSYADTPDYPLRDSYVDYLYLIVGSCNGLVLLAIQEVEDEDNFINDTEDYRLFLWNPATRKSNELPRPGAYDRHVGSVIFGIGYVDCADDFKVAGVFSVFDEEDDEGNQYYDRVVQVYSLRAGCWKTIENPPGGSERDLTSVFVNGNLHWIVRRGSGTPESWIINALDLATETYCEVLPPPTHDDNDDLRMNSGTLGERLCVLCDYRGSHAEVWVMKEYGVRDSWYQVASLSYLTDPGHLYYSVPLSISSNGKILLELDGALILYDTKSNAFTHPHIGNLGGFRDVKTYVESLVSPFVGKGVSLKKRKKMSRGLRGTGKGRG